MLQQGSRLMLSTCIATLIALHGIVHAQTAFFPPAGGKITTQISGSIKDSFPAPELYRANGGASRYNASGIVIVNMDYGVIFRNPSQPNYSWWGDSIYADSIGSRSIQDNRGVYSIYQSTPFVSGTGNYLANGGGSLSVVSGQQLAGTVPGECRLRTLDTFGAECRNSNYSASAFLESGRATYTGSLKWEPPANQSGFNPYATFKADLVVDLRFGCDGIVDAGQGISWTVGRQIDLDVVSDPIEIFVAGNSFTGPSSGYTYLDGNQAIRIRQSGGVPVKPLESGWTTAFPGLSSSFVTMQNKLTGLNWSIRVYCG